jgi:Family of unknown function (DUF6399)
MPATQPTAAEHSRQDPFRWTRVQIATALENFSDPDHPSQREAAQRFGIPHATFNYWTRHYSPTDGDPVDSFFRSAGGEALLRRIVLAALCTFQLQGACGIRQVGTFLDRAGLDRFVASSRGALHPLAAHLEADLVAFRDSQELSKAARQDATLSSLPQEEKKKVEEVAQDSAGLFQRSSSCVEGRNGRLSLQHHGHSRVSERRLKALTVIHNYMVKRPDGTTAAERFFGQQHKDVFSWLLERMPDLPRPAPKRQQPAA